MKLLVITQKIDRNDPILGFFHNWVHKLSFHFGSIKVICLYKGEYDLSNNVKIVSLGKELEFSIFNFQFSIIKKIKYAFNFYKYIWQLRGEYDAVFVHMNQEYILLGGIFWKLLGKKIYFWRNHPRGSFLTRIAVWFSEKVFCTSPQSYTARFKKGEIMPVGIDTDLFNPASSIQHPVSRESTILSLGRISLIKNIDKLVEAAILLDEKGVDFVLDIVGEAVNPEDREYYDLLQERAGSLVKKGKIKFLKSVSQEKAVELYQTHEIFVSLTPSGSMDKTILEAMACGSVPVVVDEYYKDVEGVELASLDISDIALKLESILKISDDQTEILKTSLRQYVVENHCLNALIDKLRKEIYGI